MLSSLCVYVVLCGGAVECCSRVGFLGASCSWVVCCRSLIVDLGAADGENSSRFGTVKKKLTKKRVVTHTAGRFSPSV